MSTIYKKIIKKTHKIFYQRYIREKKEQGEKVLHLLQLHRM